MCQHDESKEAFRSVQLTTCRIFKCNSGSGELSMKRSVMKSDRRVYIVDEDCTGAKNMVGGKPLQYLAQHIVRWHAHGKAACICNSVGCV